MRLMSQINSQEVLAKRISDTNTAFVIKPLERGFASTIGTAIRRTMLSSITAVAPFAIKIKGVDHEFSTLKGITEDIQMIILNVLNVHVIYDEDLFEDGKIYRAEISVSGERVAKASDIKFENPAMQVFNGEQEIATVSAEHKFQMEIFYMLGRGYVSFEDNKEVIQSRIADIKSDISRGQLIAVNSNFSPVVRVRVKTDEINTSSVFVEEELEIELETNGTVSAQAVLSQACNILIGHFRLIGNIAENNEGRIFEENTIAQKEANSVGNKDIKDLNLSVRSVNALQRHGYHKLNDLISLTEADLAAVKNLGKKSVEEIIEKLHDFKIEIKKGEE